MHLTEKEYNCLGLVIRAQPYGDKDLILTLLSEKSGKIGIIAKGAKGGKKFNSGVPDIMDLGVFELYRGRGSLFKVMHFKPQMAFKKIRASVPTYVCACCWIEAIDHLTSEAHQDSHELFEITLAVLELLNTADSARASCKILCEGLESALLKTGFGSEHLHKPSGFNKMRILAKRIEEVSSRQLKSWSALLEVVQSLGSIETSSAVNE